MRTLTQPLESYSATLGAATNTILGQAWRIFWNIVRVSWGPYRLSAETVRYCDSMFRISVNHFVRTRSTEWAVIRYRH